MTRVLLCAVFAGCQAAPTPPAAPAPAPPPPVVIEVPAPVDPAQALFERAVRELVTDGSSPAATQLLAEHQHSSLGVLVRELEQRLRHGSEQVKRLQQLEGERASCAAERDRLLAEQEGLRRGLEELKRLTIEMETRAP